MKRQVFFIYLSFRIAFLVCFWENALFTSYMACYYGVVRVGKHSNSRSLTFYKTDALKNLAIFTGKHLCWRFFLINFIKKRQQLRRFPVNIAKCLSTAFYVEYVCEHDVCVCHMYVSKTLIKCFLVYYEHVFVYCDVFAATIAFAMYLLSILNRFHTLIYFYLLSVSYWVQKKPPEVSFKKRCPLKLRNIFRKTPELGSLFNKVVGLQDCKYIKKRLQHRCFVQNLRTFLRTHFVKNICERLLL